MFIGRKQELQFLEDKYNSKGGQLVVLYGRRRVGKTETLREFCKGKQHVFYSCREVSDKLQLRSFSQKLLRQNIPAASYVKEFSDWESALKSITELPYGDSKKLLIIDEFPYMCKGNTSIPSILQTLWDEYLKDENVMIVLCGSAMSFIEKELLAEKNPLYGRATGIYKMESMGFYDAAKFFPNYSERDKIIAYAVLGGIPHYLKQFDPDISLEDNIKNNILTKGCALYSEVEFLLRQELRETSLYNSIIEAVALGNTKLNEISVKSLIDDTSKTSVYLKNLIELEIVEREFSINGKSEPTQIADSTALPIISSGSGMPSFSQITPSLKAVMWTAYLNMRSSRAFTNLRPSPLKMCAVSMSEKCRRSASYRSDTNEWDDGGARLQSAARTARKYRRPK